MGLSGDLERRKQAYTLKFLHFLFLLRANLLTKGIFPYLCGQLSSKGGKDLQLQPGRRSLYFFFFFEI